MSYSLYDATIVLARKALESLSTIIKKGEAAPNAASLLEARIHADMLPLTFQVHVVTDVSSKLLARLTGTEPTALEYNLKSYADIHARIAWTQELLAKADKEAINSRQTELVTLGLGPGKSVQLPGVGYANGYGLPNIFFHLSTAYNILRKEGVPLGKRDYQTSFLVEYITEQQ